jgi:hypothetical protein
MLSCVYKKPGLCYGIRRQSILSSEQRSNIKNFVVVLEAKSLGGGGEDLRFGTRTTGLPKFWFCLNQ